MLYKIGITGGIGSGKTKVCTVFEALGVPVYYSDMQAKKLMNTDPKLKADISECFGNDIYRDGTLDTKKMAGMVFNSKTELKKLNSLVHPAVARDFENWRLQQNAYYVLQEAAIIFESNIASRFDRVILVTAPEELRIWRVCQRDNVTPEDVKKRMKNQLPEETKIMLADYIIQNDNKRFIVPQVIELHYELLDILTSQSG